VNHHDTLRASLEQALQLSDRPSRTTSALPEQLAASAAACLEQLELPRVPAPSGGWEALEAEIGAAERRGSLRVRLTCGYCHDRLERGQASYCASCLAPHHAECFAEHGMCVIPGCEETALVRAGGASPRPVRRRALLLPGLVLAGLAGVAAYQAGVVSTSETVSVQVQDVPLEGSAGVLVDEPDSVFVGADQWLGTVVRQGDGTMQVVVLDPVPVSAGSDDGQTLQDWVSQLEEVSDVPLLLDPELADEVVPGALPGGTPWREALDQRAQELGLEVSEVAGGLLINRPMRVSFQCQGVPAAQILVEIAELAGRDIILAPGLEQTISVQVRGMHWLRALYLVVDTVPGGYVVVEEMGGLLRVVADEEIEAQLETRVLLLGTLRPDLTYEQLVDLALVLEIVLGQQPGETEIEYEPDSGALVVTAQRAQFTLLERQIESWEPGSVTSSPDGVRISYRDAPVREVLSDLAAFSDHQIVLPDDLDGLVTLHLQDVGLLKAVEAIVSTVGDYRVEEDETGVLHVTAIETETDPQGR
jgi:hypothetical protein